MSADIKSKLLQAQIEKQIKSAEEFCERYEISQEVRLAAYPSNQKFLETEESVQKGSGQIYMQMFATRAFLAGWTMALKWSKEPKDEPKASAT